MILSILHRIFKLVVKSNPLDEVDQCIYLDQLLYSFGLFLCSIAAVSSCPPLKHLQKSPRFCSAVSWSKRCRPLKCTATSTCQHGDIQKSGGLPCFPMTIGNRCLTFQNISTSLGAAPTCCFSLRRSYPGRGAQEGKSWWKPSECTTS